MKKEITIAVSILTADFLHLQAELDRIIAAKIKVIHFDVMDNHFVPNLSFGPKILSDVVNYVSKFGVIVDCHMMVKISAKISLITFLAPYINANINSIVLHYEAMKSQQIMEFLQLDIAVKKGLAINPNTKIVKLYPYLANLAYVLIMSVNPGFGNQTFIDSTYKTIAKLQQHIKKNHKNSPIIAVDGGINDVTGPKCVAFGANYLVSGSYLLNGTNCVVEQLEKLTLKVAHE